MTPERWRKVKGLFDAALNLAPAKRERFLDNACGRDDELRREVESLLASNDDAGSFMENLAVGEVAGAIESSFKKLETGRCFGHYEILRQIGAGGMGEVYLAKDKKLDRQIAVKILNENFARDESNLQRFTQEAKAASALNHPNILVIHEIGESGDVHFIVSEFIEGETLRDQLGKSPMKLSEVLDIAIQIASALAAAHMAHIIHRDIKPENIIVRPDGFVKILDFGLAKLIGQKHPLIGLEDETARQNQTAKGAILGTIKYMSPEQAKGERVDERTDIFSFGVLLYEMIAGRTPFAGNSMSETFANLINTEPPPLSRFAAVVPDELTRIVSKMLRKNRDERYQTMKGLLADLKDLRENLAFDERLEKSHPPDAENATKILQTATGNANKTIGETNDSFARQIKRHKPMVAVALMVLLAAFGFGVWRFANFPAKPTQIESIAVMPFVNESGNAEMEYLSDGMTDTLIGALSQLSNLTVKARSAVFRYKGKEMDAQTIGKELNVQTILTGRVAQRGDDLTLSLSLEDVRTGNQIWSKLYNRKLTGIIALQTEIAQDVSANLKTKLSGADERRLAKNYTVNPEAYQLYLKARSRGGTPSEAQRAISFYQQAIDLDPNYAPAYIGLSYNYLSLPLNSEIPAAETMPKAKAAAQKAVEIDDTLADAHAELADISFWYDWDLDAAEKHINRALELNPNSAGVQRLYANFLSNSGRQAEALPVIKRAIELDPANSEYKAMHGLILIRANQTDEGLAILQKILKQEPDSAWVYFYLITGYTKKGMFPEAIAAARKAQELYNNSPQSISFLAQTLGRAGKRAEARTALEELLKLSNKRYVSPHSIAAAYNGLDERDETFAWLERGFVEREPRTALLGVESRWDNLRSDPRFQDLLRRVGFMP